jgi:hypothetical protein
MLESVWQIVFVFLACYGAGAFWRDIVRQPSPAEITRW